MPVFLFAVLFGLSMDYEVFVVGAVREARRRGLGTHAAIGTAAGLTAIAGVPIAARGGRALELPRVRALWGERAW